MARLQRIVVPGQALHIVQRGNNRQAVFFAEEDYRFYLDALGRAAENTGCRIHAYVLMSNHVHLLVTPQSEEGPARLMQSVGRSYVRYVNAAYRRSGTLWEGRFKSALIDSERYLLVCSRYIELNPVRARMVERPDDYRWSSYRANTLGVMDAVVSPHWLYERLGQSPDERQLAYAAIFDGYMGDAVLGSIRDGTEKGEVLGSDRFREEVENVLKRRVVRHSHGGDRKSKVFRDFQVL